MTSAGITDRLEGFCIGKDLSCRFFDYIIAAERAWSASVWSMINMRCGESCKERCKVNYKRAQQSKHSLSCAEDQIKLPCHDHRHASEIWSYSINKRSRNSLHDWERLFVRLCILDYCDLVIRFLEKAGKSLGFSGSFTLFTGHMALSIEVECLAACLPVYIRIDVHGY